MSVHPLRLLAAIATATLAAAPVAASTESVYVANSSNGDILLVDFDAGTSDVVNADNRSDLQSLLVRDDGLGGVSLVVCETQTGKVWFYPTEPLGEVTGSLISEGHIELPDAVSSAPGGDLYLVNSRAGGSPDATREVWKLERDCPTCPGGYDSVPILIDGDVPADLLADTLVLSYTPAVGTLAAGDLLVLAEKPAQVWLYRGGNGPRELFIDTGGDGLPEGSAPTGMAIAPDGNLLVTVLAGDILRFDMTGARLSPDFANGLGAGKLRIAVGLQGGEPRAFVTDRNGGDVLRFRIEDDGTGTYLDQVSDGVQFPVGVGIATAGAAPTLAGDDVTIAPASSAKVRFEEVTASGLTSARVFLFTDPGPGRDRKLSEVPGLLDATGLPDATIPSYVNAFDLDGVATFVLHTVDTSALFAETFEIEIFENRLGFATACTDDSDPDKPLNPSPTQPRLFHATDTDDPPVVEGSNFFDISSACGSSPGRGWSNSANLTGWDSRSPADIATDKLDQLELVVTVDDPANGGLAGYIDKKIGRRLDGLIDAAHRAVDQGRLDRAVEKLDEFIATVRDNPSKFDNSARNVTGELIARAESAAYLACGAVVPDCNRFLP